MKMFTLLTQLDIIHPFNNRSNSCSFNCSSTVQSFKHNSPITIEESSRSDVTHPFGYKDPFGHSLPVRLHYCNRSVIVRPTVRV